MTFERGNPLFRNRETLLAEIARQNLSIVLESTIQKSFESVPVGGRPVGNRFVIHPMEGCDGTLDGKPTETTYHRWGRFARGGAKLIWGEAVAVLPEGRANPRQLLLTRKNVPELQNLISFAREEHRKACGTTEDLLIGIQLTHSGRYSVPKPSALFQDPSLPAADEKILSDDELDRLQDHYVQAATWLKEAGADFVDFKQCHRYLLSELLAAKTRKGKYGGSLENRTRFVRDVMKKIGNDILLATRMNLFDGIPFSTDGKPFNVALPYRYGFGVNENNPLEPDLTEPLEAIRLFKEAGLALLNVSMGSPYFNPHYGRPADTPPPDGYHMPESGLAGVDRHFRLTETVQRMFPDLPIVGTGYSYLRHFAAEAGEANIRDGRTTFMGVGRGAIAYPDFINDLKQSGAMEKNKSCITVSYCTSLMRAKNNELGQYAAGCVPRDSLYAKLYQEVQKKT